MAANTSPIFASVPQISWGTLTTANTAMDGTGTVVTVFTAGANGALINGIKVKSLGSSVQTVVRVFLNNGSTNATAANNSLYTEATIASTTASAATATADVYIPLAIALAAGYKINVAIGTTVASGLQITADGGNY